MAHVVGVRRRAAADDTRLAGDVAEVLFAADAPRLADRQDALVYLWTPVASPLRNVSCIFGARVAFGVRERDSALLEVRDELRRDAGFREVILLQGSIEGTHDIHVVLPYREERLDVGSLGHRFTQRSCKVTRLIEGCLLGAGA